MYLLRMIFFFFSSRRRHTRLQGDWSSDVCSSDLGDDRDVGLAAGLQAGLHGLVGGGEAVGEVGARELAARRALDGRGRSEERRVGKEGRGRGGTQERRDKRGVSRRDRDKKRRREQ